MNLRKLFKKDKTSEIVQAFYSFFGTLNLFSSSSKNSIKYGYNYNPDVYSVISFVSSKASSLPFLLKDKNDNITETSEFQDILKAPNPMMSWNDVIEQLMGYLLITGDAYLYAPRSESGNNRGKLLPGYDLEVLPSHLVDIEFDNQGNIGNYYLNAVRIDPGAIIHVNYFNPLNEIPGTTGLSPIQAGRLSINRANKNYEASSRMFDNLGAVGILSANQSTESFGLTKEQKEEIKSNLKKQMSGTNNAGEVIITSGSVNWQSLGQSPADLKLIEDRKMGIKEICNLYHIPSALFGDSDSTQYSNLFNARQVAWTDAISPALEKILAKLNKDLIGYYGVYMYPDYSVVSELQKDKKELTEWLEKAWWIKGSRKQEIMGEEPDPQMDMYFIPNGMTPMGSVEEPTDKEVDQYYGNQTEL